MSNSLSAHSQRERPSYDADVGPQIRPEAIDDTRALDVHRCFASARGADHIATLSALSWLSAVVRLVQPRRVLEMGAGIGTLTRLLLSYPVEQVVATEQNEMCLNLLHANLAQDARLRVVTSPAELAPLGFEADLIVSDGGFYADSDEEFRCARLNTLVFVEGDRCKLRARMAEHLRGRGLDVRFAPYGKSKFPSGLGIRRRWGVPLPHFVWAKSGGWLGRVRNGSAA